MKKYNLDGVWDLYYFPQKQSKVRCPADLKVSNLKPISAQVPGNVELDLVRAGILPDPFFANNIRCLKPYEVYEWWYQRTFHTPAGLEGKKVSLVFHGTDCLATYWLNDEQIGSSDNMFIEHSFDITGKLNSSTPNTITVRLRSPIIEAAGKEYQPYMFALDNNWEQLWIRKAPHSYGWDIMCRAVSAGLWRSVELVVLEEHEIKDLYFYTTAIGKDWAKIGVFYEIETDPELFRELELQFSARCGESSFTFTVPVLFKTGNFDTRVENPKLWWPRGYGEPDLYEVETKLLHKGEVLAERRDTLGIRTVELVRTDITTFSDPGEFLFKINGTPIMCKGSNWVPADAFHSRDASRYKDILELFKDSCCNIIRCWGGNVYEDHSFFDFCDRNGIMVWQDFAMACAFYPQDEEFLETIRKEAVSVVKKLRNHPSLVIWCGDNENDMMAYMRGMNTDLNRITREVLARVTFQCDPYRPYLPSSPYLTNKVVENKDIDLASENHLWGTRDYYKSTYYTQSKCHFISEIGYHGCPNLSSIKRFIDKEHLWPWENNEQWITHCTDPIEKGGKYSYRVQLMANQIKEMFGILPDNIEDFILASQISQAEAKKFFIELTRTNKWRRTGIIWWNMIDGWPQFSDAVVDYYFGKKLAYYYIKRVQQPVCLMMKELYNWHLTVVAGNDSNNDATGQYRIWDADTEEIILQGTFHTKANENEEIGKIRVSHSDKRLFLMEWTVDGIKGGNHYLLGFPPFSLERYKVWLKKIAALPNGFKADEIGK